MKPFTETEVAMLEKLIKREMGTVDTLVSLDPQLANASKTSLKSLLDKVKANPGLLRDDDILACDEEVTFDEILLAKNGNPIARIRLPKGV